MILNVILAAVMAVVATKLAKKMPVPLAIVITFFNWFIGVIAVLVCPKQVLTNDHSLKPRCKVWGAIVLGWGVLNMIGAVIMTFRSGFVSSLNVYMASVSTITLGIWMLTSALSPSEWAEYEQKVAERQERKAKASMPTPPPHTEQEN